jgi:hypothetical protein
MADICFLSKAVPELKLQDHLMHIGKQRKREFQPQPMLESRVADAICCALT